MRTFLLLALVAAGLASLWLPAGLRDLAHWPLIAALAAVFVLLLVALAMIRVVRRGRSRLCAARLQSGKNIFLADAPAGAAASDGCEIHMMLFRQTAD